jgi:hypothetical protein
MYSHSQGSFVTLNTTNTLLFVVGIVTGLWAGGIRVKLPARHKNNFFITTSRQVLRLTVLVFNGYQGFFFRR